MTLLLPPRRVNIFFKHEAVSPQKTIMNFHRPSKFLDHFSAERHCFYKLDNIFAGTASARYTMCDHKPRRQTYFVAKVQAHHG